MKLTMSLLAAVLMSAGFHAKAESVTVEKVITVNDALVPEFAAKDQDVKVVVSGTFPNSCYRWSRSDVRTHTQSFHVVRALALVTTNTNCLMVLVPFSKEINVGRLSPGEHTLRFLNGDDTWFERKLTVQ